MGLSNTLNRFSNRPPSRYSSAHQHHPLMNLHATQQSMQTPPRGSTLPGKNASFAFEPNFPSHHSHPHGQKSELQQHLPNSCGHPSSAPITMSLRSNSSKLLYRNSDDLLGAHLSSPIENSGTFPRKREPQRIRIPSNQSVTSRSSMEKFELRNSPMPSCHIEVSCSKNFSPTNRTMFTKLACKLLFVLQLIIEEDGTYSTDAEKGKLRLGRCIGCWLRLTNLVLNIFTFVSGVGSRKPRVGGVWKLAWEEW